jgi:Family of unknown function (DUF6518)
MSSSPSPAPELAIRPSLIGRAVEGLGTSVLVGAALGALAWLSDQLQWPYSLLIPANMIGVWLGIAFALGASARTIPTGAIRGLIGLLAAVAIYYLLFATLGAGYRAIGAGHAATVWGLVALIAGPIMGGAGAVWRHGSGRPRAIAVAVLAAALIAEGAVFGISRLIHLDQLRADPGALLFGAEILIGLALPAILLRKGERFSGYAVTAGFAILGALAIGPVTSILRGIADRF